MELWEVLVPTVNNDGRPFRTRYHKVWDKKVYEITGGLSIMPPLRGKWMHNTHLYEERNIPVRIACNREQLNEILRFTKEYYKQIKVFAYLISSEVIVYE